MTDNRFGEELTLNEVLELRTDQEKEHDRFIRSAPGSNFGPELTLVEVLDILHQSALPLRAGFWEKNDRVVQEAIHSNSPTLEIGDYRFKIEYFARIKSVREYDFSVPMAYIKVHPNGKGSNDPQGSSRDTSTTGSSSDSDV